MKQTAMQKHIEWLEETIEIAEQQAPILVNALNLCLNDAKHRLIMEKEQIGKAFLNGRIKQIGSGVLFDLQPLVETFDNYYNETFKSE